MYRINRAQLLRNNAATITKENTPVPPPFAPLPPIRQPRADGKRQQQQQQQQPTLSTTTTQIDTNKAYYSMPLDNNQRRSHDDGDKTLKQRPASPLDQGVAADYPLSNTERYFFQSKLAEKDAELHKIERQFAVLKRIWNEASSELHIAAPEQQEHHNKQQQQQQEQQQHHQHQQMLHQQQHQQMQQQQQQQQQQHQHQHKMRLEAERDDQVFQEVERRLAELFSNDAALDEYVARLRSQLANYKAAALDAHARLEAWKQALGKQQHVIKSLREKLDESEANKNLALKTKQLLQTVVSELLEQLQEARAQKQSSDEQCMYLTHEVTNVKFLLEDQERNAEKILKKYQAHLATCTADANSNNNSNSNNNNNNNNHTDGKSSGEAAQWAEIMETDNRLLKEKNIELEVNNRSLRERIKESEERLIALESSLADKATLNKLEAKCRELEDKLGSESIQRQRIQVGHTKEHSSKYIGCKCNFTHAYRFDRINWTK